jgi:hypothetical protein
MVDKIELKNQVSPVVSPTLRMGRPASEGAFKPGHGGSRAGAGRPKGSENRVTNTFRDVLLQAVSDVGSSRVEGVDANDGLYGYLKKAAIREEKTTLLLLGRILPQKITSEVKQLKEKMTIHEAVADLKACGLDPLLAFYLQRYPIGRDEKDPSWADGINLDAAYDLPTEVTPKNDTENDTTK